jgi:iron complex outermembrane receptor protein
VDYSDIYTVPYAPENTTNISVRYDFLNSRYGNYSAILDYQYQAKTFSGPRPTDFNEAYDLWNARVQIDNIALGNHQLRIGLWGKNLADEEYTTLTSNLGQIASVFGMPRTFGIDMVFDF